MPTEPAGAGRPTWHWWSAQEGGRSRAKEEMDDLPPAERAALALVIKRVIDGTTRGQDVKPLASGVLEARAQLNGVWLRCAYARWGHDFVGLTVFKKKQNRTEPKDLDRATQRWKDWQASRGAVPAK